MRAEFLQIDRSRLIPLLAWLGLPALVVLVYWPGLGGGFVFDDFSSIVNNTALHIRDWRAEDLLAAAFSSPASDLQRPLAVVSFAINFLFTGMDPWPMKLTNVGLHALNSLLVFVLVRRLLRMSGNAVSESDSRSHYIALFVSACWALNPINLMAVLYVVQRMEALSHTFVFVGLWLYLLGRQRQINGRSGAWPRILAGLVAFTGLGLLAKESAALLPLYALCIELCVLRFRVAIPTAQRQLFLTYALVLVLPALFALAWLLPRALAPGAFSIRDFNLSERLLTEPRVVLDYLRWTLFPSLQQLGLHHDDYVVSRSLWNPITTAPAIVSLGALAILAWFGRHHRPLAALGLMWFLSAHVMTATFLPLELVFEHRNYFASLGVCLALADLLLMQPVKAQLRKLCAGLAFAFLGLSILVTYLRANEWSTPFRFSASEAAKHPQSPRAQYEFGRRLVMTGDYQADSPFTKQAYVVLERASALPKSGVLPEQALILLAARTGAPVNDVWWERMDHKLATDPIAAQELGSLAALTHCAVVRKCELEPDRMLAMYASALKAGDNPEVLNIYGDYVLNVLGDGRLALDLWKQASRSNPKEVQYHASRAKLLIVLRRFDEAREEIATIAATGRLGQNQAAADALSLRLRAAQAQPAPSMAPEPTPIIE